jgi:hypothetical protein
LRGRYSDAMRAGRSGFMFHAVYLCLKKHVLSLPKNACHGVIFTFTLK